MCSKRVSSFPLTKQAEAVDSWPLNEAACLQEDQASRLSTALDQARHLAGADEDGTPDSLPASANGTPLADASLPGGSPPANGDALGSSPGTSPHVEGACCDKMDLDLLCCKGRGDAHRLLALIGTAGACFPCVSRRLSRHAVPVMSSAHQAQLAYQWCQSAVPAACLLRVCQTSLEALLPPPDGSRQLASCFQAPLS